MVEAVGLSLARASIDLTTGIGEAVGISLAPANDDAMALRTSGRTNGYCGDQLPKAPRTPAKEIPGYQFSTGESALTGDEDLAVARYLAETRKLPAYLSDDAVVPFLKFYGYVANSNESWVDSKQGAYLPGKPTPAAAVYLGMRQPLISFNLNGHHEFGGHTQYTIRCELTTSVGDAVAGEPLQSWGTIRRLAHFREGVYDAVKRELGSKYDHFFHNTPFALPSAPRGTTSRLNLWFSSLAVAMNRGAVPPFLVAYIFRVLDGPGTECHPLAEKLPLTSSIFGGGGINDNPTVLQCLANCSQWTPDIQVLQQRPPAKRAATK